MAPASVPGHIVVGVVLPVAVNGQIRMVQASGRHQGMDDVVVVVVTVWQPGVGKADGTKKVAGRTLALAWDQVMEAQNQCTSTGIPKE